MIGKTFIKRHQCSYTGGGIWIDFIDFKDGKVLALGSDACCLYPSMDGFMDGDYIGCFELPDFDDDAFILDPSYIESIHGEYGLDVIVLKSGHAIGIDSDSIVLHPSVDAIFDGVARTNPTINY